MLRFDSKNNSLFVDNVAIFDFATGDPVTFAKDNDNVQIFYDANGKSWAVTNNKGGGKINVRVLPGTPSFKKLMQLARGQDSFTVALNLTGETVSATEAIIMRTPNGSWAEGSPMRDFQIALLDYKHDVA